MLINSEYFHSSTTVQVHITLSDNTTVHLTQHDAVHSKESPLHHEVLWCQVCCYHSLQIPTYKRESPETLSPGKLWTSGDKAASVSALCTESKEWDIWGSHSNASESYDLLGCENVSLGEWFLTSWRNVVPTFSGPRNLRRIINVLFLFDGLTLKN